MFIPFCKPTIERDEIEEVVESLESGWITTGPKVVQLENKFKEMFGQEALAVNSATAGLHLALKCLNLSPSDEVITTSITWPSTVNNIEICGARPIFADVEKDTLQISSDDIAKKITEHTKAVIPVHFAGAPVDLDEIRRLCKSNNIEIIEDAAHAIGTRYKNRLIGSDSKVAVFSFHPIKNITTGEGGMILTSSSKWAERMRRLRFHGISRDAWKRYSKGGTPQYEVVEPGFKYNMLDIQAAIGLHQLAKLDRFNNKRKELARNYFRLLDGLEAIMPLMPPEYDHYHAWHLFVVRLDIDMLSVDRDTFIMELQEEGVGVGLHFPAIHLQSYYRKKYGFKEGALPNAEWNSKRLFSLPLYPLLTFEQQEVVVDKLSKLIKRHKR